jgi:hypothetical protein
MGTKKKKVRKNKEEEQELRFDPKSRHAFLTGFRKRKDARRKKASIELIEKSRQEKIDIKREHREEIKKRWKDVCWAERTVDRVLDKRASMMKERQLALGDRHAPAEDSDFDDLDAGEDGWMPALEDEPADVAKPGTKTVRFQREEDDPFGDCEVTTSAVALSNLDEANDDRPMSNALALQKKDADCFDLVLAGPKRCSEMTPEELEEHRRRRAIALRKEEGRRKAAIDRQIKRDKLEAKRMKKKSKKNKVKKVKGRAVKAGARQRRNRKGK